MKPIIYKLFLEERYSLADFATIYLIALLIHNLF